MVARSYRHLLLVVCVGWAITPVAAADDARLRAALESVTADELYAHVATLADDVFEGRGVGSRGGYAAAQYILGELRPCGLRPAGTDGDYFQLCDDGGRNILGVLPGSDPRLQQEYIIVGAHYDHVGDGRRGRANGPIGSIFNGADDNASGVATLLETIEALAESGVGVRRSILFAFWDGEEVGLVGSKRWFDAPTIPPNAVRMTINIDMVGRLRDGQLQVLGTRTGYGMRRLLSGELDDRLQLDFSWELTGNSDHWPFVEHQIPAVMLHTGLHDDYHRPSDDVEKINPAGMEVVTRYLLARLIAVANVEALPAYRATGRYETLAMQRRATERIQYVSRGGWPGAAPPRLGISWRTDDAEPGSVSLTYVAAHSPAAAAGLAIDDRIHAVNDRPFGGGEAFRRLVIGQLDAGAARITFEVESRGHVRTVTVRTLPPAPAADAST